jgi:hypothetical protein
MEWITAIIFYCVGVWAGSKYPVKICYTEKQMEKMHGEGFLQGYTQRLKEEAKQKAEEKQKLDNEKKS